MKNKIKDNIDNSGELEKLYQSNKKDFKKAFFEVYSEISEYQLSDFWKIRLEFSDQQEKKGIIGKADILFLIIACILSGFLIKIPDIFNIDFQNYLFYEKNAALIVFFGLSIYAFLTKNTRNLKHVIISFCVFLVAAIFINILPSNRDSHSINLAYIHLPLLLWCVYGLIYIDFNITDKSRRIDYLKYNGELAILMALIFIAGGILAGVTFGLFSAIGLKIEQFYFDYIVIWGLVSAPILATFIIRIFPSATNKMAPIIANIFSPLVLITLIIYLVSIVITGKNPYNDRDFLIVFNGMLLGVMGIIVFSVTETSITKKQRFSEITLFVLAIITLVIDLVALSAILYRLGEFGFTPNRTAVLGSNLLIFGNLVLIMFDLYGVNFKNKEIKQVELTIAKYLPVYMIWTVFAVFLLPFLFGLK